MSSLFCRLATLCLSAHFSLAAAADMEPVESPAAQELRACAGVNNETTKQKALMRELAVYIGQTVPDELHLRATKHVDLVVKLKEECERLRRLTAAAK